MFNKRINKIGMFIGPEYISVCKNEHGTYTERHYRYETPCYNVESLLNEKSLLEQAVTDIRQEIGKGYYKINIALADPYVTSRVVELNHDPKSQDDLSEYLRWRLKSDYFIDVAGKVITYQNFGMKEGKYIILAQACDNFLVRNIIDLFARVGVPVNLIDTAYNYLHNYFIDNVGNKASFLLLHQGAFWTVASLDGDGRPVQIKSAWIKGERNGQAATENEEDSVFARIGRSVYQDLQNYRFENSEIPTVYVLGDMKTYYKTLCAKYVLGKCELLKGALGRSVYSDLTNKKGEFAIERLAVICQR